MVELIYNFFLLKLSYKRILLLGILSNYIVKFTTYHLYYKKTHRITRSYYRILLFFTLSNYITKFAAYFLYYEKKYISNLIEIFVYTT